MKIKKGVILNGLSIEMSVAMRIIDEEFKSHDCKMVVTCGLDGTHMAGSLHYSGYAIDVKTNNICTGDIKKIICSLISVLKKIDSRYGLYFHATHLHVQYKPERYTELWGKYAN